MGERLASGNVANALLANSIATGAGLYVLIVMFAPISGAHFNPIVTAVTCFQGELPASRCGIYVIAQLMGALSGVLLAHAMFGLTLLQISVHSRPTAGEGLGEMIATFGLVLVILLLSRFNKDAIPMAVAGFIASAYWFTSSSFANPAVTLARALTDTFAGISPDSIVLFIGGQLFGGLAATFLARWMCGRTPAV